MYLAGCRRAEAGHEAGIIHRDIKPHNLLLDTKGTVKVLDMGLARIGVETKDRTQLTQTGSFMGTADFMPPEQAADSKQADQRADIYSLGCTLYYLLTGTVMYEGNSLIEKLTALQNKPIPSLRQSHPEVSVALEAVYLRMVAKKAEKRFQTMQEAIGELKKCQAETVQTGSLMPLASGLGIPSDIFRQETQVQGKGETSRTNPHGRRSEVFQQETQVPARGEPTKAAPSMDRGSNKRGWAFWVGALAVVLLVLGGAAFFGGAIFKINTKAGIVVLEINEPGAEVVVDGKKITITRAGDQEPVRIDVDEGTHQLMVVKGGFETFTKQFSLKSGKSETIKVRLEEAKIVAVDTKTKSDPMPEPKVDPKPEPKIEPKSDPKPEPKVEKIAEPKPGPKPESKDPIDNDIQLFNKKDLSGFYTYLGVAKTYPGPPTKGEKPYGKNNDPQGVFVVQDGVIRVSGKVWGGLSTEQEFENYHLIVEYKWGEQTWPPREAKARNSGILLHCIGADWDGQRPWPESIDCQLGEGNAGTLFPLARNNIAGLTAEAEKRNKQYYFKPGGV